jgi:hypothetical protein
MRRRRKRLFFRQLEPAETLIYLAEVNAKEGRRVSVPPDVVEGAQGSAKGYKPLRRYACKMATGAGKTFVMAMLAAWSFLNRAQYPKHPRFSDATLAVCPGLTIVERLLLAIEPDESRGEQRLLPRIERFRRKGSTRDVDFFTVRECRETLKSHVSHVVLDSTQWEGGAAFWLEASEEVVAYAKNDHLGFLIPYDYDEKPHLYTPDFVIRLRNGLTLIVETKGQEREQDRQKYVAAERRVSAVSNAGEWGRWAFAVCKDMAELPGVLRRAADGGIGDR